LCKLVEELNDYLDIHRVPDYCPNGLQVEGAQEVSKIITGVTASLEFLQAAVKSNADAVLVHHGYFWKGDEPVIVGPLYRRLHTLMTHDMSLITYHLPLDLHPDIGNNHCFGQLMGVDKMQTFEAGGVPGLGWQGEFNTPVSADELAMKLEAILDRTPLHIAGSSKPIRRVAWCTGAAQDYIVDAALSGVDAYITGEVSERTTHLARELGLHFYAAGHHATERYGIQALGQFVAERYAIEVEFIDINNPV